MISVNQTLETPSTRITDYWAVRFAPHVDVDKLNLVPGLRLMTHLFDGAERVHIFHFQFPHLPFPFKLGEHVKWIERQVARKRLVRVATPNDPLYRGAWNLHGHPGMYSTLISHTLARALSLSLSLIVVDSYCWHYLPHTVSMSGIDVNVEAAWNMGVSGVNSTIVIVDDGINESHAEFAGRFCAECSYDFNYLRESIEPFRWDIHGTAAAGVAAGAVGNNVCSAGIAPGARIGGVRILAADVVDYQEAQALGFRTDINMIFSNSWGPSDDGIRLEGPGAMTKQALYNGITQGRNGLGTIYVWACGNGRQRGDSCNYDGYANSRFTIAVASYEISGAQAWYSESCASLIISTPSSGSHPPEISSAATQGTCTEHFTGTSASWFVAIRNESAPAIVA
jgi:subtilisin family serine protease